MLADAVVVQQAGGRSRSRSACRWSTFCTVPKDEGRRRSDDVDRLGTAVLFSAGLDSAVLVAQRARARQRVAALRQRRAGVGSRRAQRWARGCSPPRQYAGQSAPLADLQFTMADVYPPTHWAVRGCTAAHNTPDEDVYLTRAQSRAALPRPACGARSIASAASPSGRWRATRFPTRRPEFFASITETLLARARARDRDRHASFVRSTRRTSSRAGRSWACRSS